MVDTTIHIRALIRLLPTDEGGRTTPVRASYRPIHNFGFANGDMANASIDLPEGETLAPGNEREMEISFLRFPNLEREIRPGREWAIQEGGWVVGKGIVLEVLS